MREGITAHSIANDIRMTRSQYAGAFLLVEGETADLRVYKRLFDVEACQIIPAHGKANAIEALDILEQDTFLGALAIVDADFWRLEGKELSSENLFITDSHDLETMLLQSPALEKLLDEFGSANKIATFTKQRGVPLRQALLDIGRPLGYFRWISLQHSYELTFNNITFSRFVDKKTLALDTVRLIQTVKNKSGRHDLNEATLQKQINEAASEAHASWDICSGHDLVIILSLGLGRVLGSNKAEEVKPELLEKFLRTGYEVIYFSATQLYHALQQWEANNPSFRVFPTTT